MKTAQFNKICAPWRRIATGTRVKITNICSAKKYRGKVGTVSAVECDRIDGWARYALDLDGIGYFGAIRAEFSVLR